MVLAATSPNMRSTDRGHRDHDGADVTDLFREPVDEAFLGRRLGFSGRVFEHRIEGVPHIDGPRPIVDLDDVPADVPAPLVRFSSR